MKIFTVAFVVTLFCAALVSAAPSPSTNELTLFDHEPFDAIDGVTKWWNSIIEKTKCTLDAVGDLIGKGELRTIYKKFRADVDVILRNDVKKCMDTKGLIERVKCSLTVNQKLNTLYANFIKEVIKTKTDIAGKLFKALRQCSKKSPPNEKPFELPIDDEFMLFDEESFGLIDIVTKALNLMIEKTKCTLDAVGKLVGEGELKTIYMKFRADVDAILQNDVKKCMDTKGLIERIKCSLTVNQKLNTLYANFFREVIKRDIAGKFFKALYECALIRSPEEKPFESTIDAELILFDEEPFGLIDIVTKILNSIIEKTKCTLDVIGKLIGNGELRDVYKKFRADVDAILKNDVKKCMDTEGLIERIKCSLTVTQKLNTLYANFIKKVIKTNTDLAWKLFKALYECSIKGSPNEKPDEKPFELIIDDEFELIDGETFGLIDIVTKAFNAMIEKAKCTLDVIDKLIGNGELRNVYRKFRADVEAILKNDVKKCMATKGFIAKMKCALTVNQKLNTLYANFLKSVFKAHWNIGMKLTKALFKCAMKWSPSIPDDKSLDLPSNDELTFDLVDTAQIIDDGSVFGPVDVVEKILNYIKCFIDAISKAVSGTDLAPVWEATKKDIDVILNRLKDCRNGENIVDEIRCTISELRSVIPIIKNVVGSLKEAHREIYDRIHENVKKCQKF